MRSYVGPYPVVVTRDMDGALHIFENRCAHRGVEFCREYRGKADSFICPYHNWTYDLKGDLTAIPFRRGVKGKGGAPKDFEIKEDTGDEGGFFKSAGDYVDKGKLEKEYYAKQRLDIVNECHEQLKQEMRDILISKTERKRIAKELIDNVRKDAEKEVANAVEIANAERTKVKAQIAEKKAKAEAEAKKQAEKEAAEAAAAAEAAKKEAEAAEEAVEGGATTHAGLAARTANESTAKHKECAARSQPAADADTIVDGDDSL